MEKKLNNLIHKIKLLNDNQHYRFGDVIYHKGDYWRESTSYILNNAIYDGSILKEYILKSPNNNMNDFNVNYKQDIISIIDNYKCDTLPDKNELVIHLRTGDVVNTPLFLKKQYYNIVKWYVINKKIKKCSFCTAFHYGNCIEKNKWIFNDDKHKKNIKMLKQLLYILLTNFKYITFDIKSSNNIDEDMCYMYKARYFEPDFGGFSKLIYQLRNK